MKHCSKEDYSKAVSELVRLITEKHGSEVRAIYAGGSYARGDFVPGRSDVDVYVVMKDEVELRKDLEGEARQVEEKLLRGLKPSVGAVLDVTTTTEGEIEKGRSFLGAGFEYSDFVNDGKLLWGEDIKDRIPRTSIEDQEESARTNLKQIYKTTSDWEKSFRWFSWIPFILVPRKNKELWTRYAFNLTFRTAAVFLASRGVFVCRKEDITRAFRQSVGKEELCSTVSLALSLWEKWKTQPLGNKETKLLFVDSLSFVKRLQQLQ